MEKYKFNEKATEWHAKLGKEIPVFKTPKYQEAKKKAIEIIESKKYGVTEADFWILMNATKSGKMAYNGLIISHNGCLKINDSLDNKFNPESVWHDKEGYGSSLVFHYADKEQGIYEVGEISKSNCQNEYPYAMAFKRLFDRVVLKLSKLAYSGIYSDSESDEFAQHLEAGGETPDAEAEKIFDACVSEPSAIKPGGEGIPAKSLKFTCADCGNTLEPIPDSNGKPIPIRAHADKSEKMFGRVLCLDCIRKINSENANR